MMKVSARFLAALASLWLVACPASAQESKAGLGSTIINCFPDNVVGAITPAIMRSCASTFVASWQQYAGVNPQTGTSYTIQASDYGQLVTFTNSSPVAVSLPQATGSFATFNFHATNFGNGSVTITPTTSTIDGSATFVLQANQSIWVVSDGVNYQVWNAFTSPASFPAQSANTVYAGPTTGSAATPIFRPLVGTDLPVPGASSLGGVEALTCASHQWLNTISIAGVPACSQPSFSDINGTFTAAQCVAATTGALGCVKPDGTTITIASGVITAVGGTATSIDAAGATSVSNCGTALAGLYNTSSSKVGCIAGQWQYIGTVSLSGGAIANSTIISGASASYTRFRFEGHGITTTTTSSTVLWQWFVGGSAVTSGYLSSTNAGNGSSAGTQAATAGIQIDQATSVSSTLPLEFTLEIKNPSVTAACKTAKGDFAGVNATPSMITGTMAGCIQASTGALQGFQMSGGGSLTGFNGGQVDVFASTN